MPKAHALEAAPPAPAFDPSGEEPALSTPAAKTAFKRAALSIGAATLGAYGLGAVLTYSASDPSLNTATDAAPQNLFGAPGAVLADVMMQTLGVAAPAAMAALAAGGALRIAQKRLLRPIPQGRLLSGAAAIALLAGLAAYAPRPGAWPLGSGLGGMTGDAVRSSLTGLLSVTGIPSPEVFGGIAAAAGGLAALGWAFRMTRDDVNAMAGAVAGAARKMGAGVKDASAAAASWTKRPIRLAPPMDQAQDHLLEAPAYAGGSPTRISMAPAYDPSAAQTPPDYAAFEAPPRARAAQPSAPAPAAPQTPGQPPPAQPTAARAPTAAAPTHQPPTPAAGAFRLPSLDLLTPPKQRAIVADGPTLQATSRRLESVLADFGVQGEIVAANPGPVITLFEFEPAPGVKSARVTGLADDIARSMSATSARVAVIPGRNAIGIELPNAKRETVFLRALLGSNPFIGNQGGLPLALGESIEGEPVVADLAKMPHLLIAGTTGSGKSVGINAMILSLLYRHTPEQCQFIMIDPKVLELSIYEGIPHLLAPVVTKPEEAVVALKWTVREMEERYRRMSKLGVRNIHGYNERVREALARGERLERTVHTGFDAETGEPTYETRELPLESMPYLVVVIDEVAELMLAAGKEVETCVQRLAQMARAAGIHVIMSTQRPSVDVITGTIRANFPTRISYSVISKVDSRVILGDQGAEQLLGMGDLLFMAGGGRIRRLHGPFVSDDEVESVVNMLRAQGAPSYRSDVTVDIDDGGEDDTPDLVEQMGGPAAGEDLYEQAVHIVIRDRKASTSYIQRRLGIGYNRAATLVERMEKDGVISAPNGAGKRQILRPPLNE